MHVKSFYDCRKREKRIIGMEKSEKKMKEKLKSGNESESRNKSSYELETERDASVNEGSIRYKQISFSVSNEDWNLLSYPRTISKKLDIVTPNIHVIPTSAPSISITIKRTLKWNGKSRAPPPMQNDKEEKLYLISHFFRTPFLSFVIPPHSYTFARLPFCCCCFHFEIIIKYSSGIEM